MVLQTDVNQLGRDSLEMLSVKERLLLKELVLYNAEEV